MTERFDGPHLPKNELVFDTSQETIALLQEEVARLEAELRARDEAAELPTPPWLQAEPEGASSEAGERALALAEELNGRDETIAILLDQCRLFEEAAAAQKAEWDHLYQWVEEVERRVDGKDAREGGFEADLDAERRRSEAERQAFDVEKRSWDARRRATERETADLRAALARSEHESADSDSYRAVVDENQKLREICLELERVADSAVEVEPLRERLQIARAKVEELEKQLRGVLDARQREVKEHEAELSALRSKIAIESLQKAAEPVASRQGAAAAERRDPALEADERIRAFRQHLREVHERESEQRAGKSLSARLSRLWHHTGPA